MNEIKRVDLSTWMKDQHGFHYCRNCGRDADYIYNAIAKNYYEHLSNFCPTCGSRMSLEEDN